jgi:hypothetical protein
MTNDGSTTNLDANVIPIFCPYAFHHEWLKDVVCQHQKKLLLKYEVVVFVEVDEMLYSLEEPLNIYLQRFIQEDSLVKTCIAHELIHDIENEPDWHEKLNLLKIRNTWFRDTAYDKTLVSKIPLDWLWGFHTASNAEPNIDNKLFMLHIHRFDYKTKIKRNIERLQNIESHSDKGGGQNRILDPEWIKWFFKEKDSQKTPILENHKNYLINCFEPQT